MSFELYYWPQIPGRGEYVRLLLEEAGADYVDVAREQGSRAVVEVIRGSLGGVPPFAPPVLKHDDVVIAQTANICQYLARELGLVDADPGTQAVANMLAMTLADLAAEVHDTHHPVSTALYYEDQRDEAIAAAAKFREIRIPKFGQYFTRVLGDKDTLLAAFSYVDLFLAHTMDGLDYAFPKEMAARRTELQALVAHRDRVRSRERIAAYLASDRRIPFNEHGIFRRHAELDRG